MKKYFSTVEDLIKSRRAGIVKNSALWANMPVTAAILDQDVADIELINTQIEETEHQLSQLIAQGKKVVMAKEQRVLQIDKLASGLHSDDLPKLSDYGIAPKKTGATSKPKPEKGVVKSIKDDTDGVGFIIERDVVANATTYEWQKAEGDDPAITNIDEGKMNHFKITNKKVFVDDEVKKGTRYFYRFRGVNSSGNGAWSEPVSRVQ
ncbi:MAG: fibronectin type III domain-containing protein [Flavobacterium sp.]|nr:fibronectin type III domain-containing protein [Flavobacterium sp.]